MTDYFQRMNNDASAKPWVRPSNSIAYHSNMSRVIGCKMHDYSFRFRRSMQAKNKYCKACVIWLGYYYAFSNLGLQSQDLMMP